MIPQSVQLLVKALGLGGLAIKQFKIIVRLTLKEEPEAYLGTKIALRNEGELLCPSKLPPKPP